MQEFEDASSFRNCRLHDDCITYHLAAAFPYTALCRPESEGSFYCKLFFCLVQCNINTFTINIYYQINQTSLKEATQKRIFTTEKHKSPNLQ